MEKQEGGPIARKQAIKRLRSQGLEARAKAREVKIDRYLELWQIKIALVRQRSEAEMGLARARRQLEVLAHADCGSDCC